MRIVNDVKWGIDRDAYAAASARFVELCEECGIGRDRVGFFGEVGFPGVSDLDALVVGDAAVLMRLVELHKAEVKKNEAYGYLFCHEPLWILDEVAELAHRLHSLEGLMLPEGLPGAPMAGIMSEMERHVLNVAWLVCLLGVVAEIAMRGGRRDGVGIRLLLLIHKNLRHSMSVFESDGNNRGSAMMGALELREWARKHCLQGNELEAGRIVWGQIMSSLSAACEGMDAACRPMALDADEEGRWIITRRMVFHRGLSTVFDAGLGRIVLSPYAFLVAKGYLCGWSRHHDIDHFLSGTRRCHRAYERVGLPYPFIEPIAVASSGWRRQLTLGVNRLADTCGRAWWI